MKYQLRRDKGQGTRDWRPGRFQGAGNELNQNKNVLSDYINILKKNNLSDIHTT
jgi:hypothetical protein